MSERFPGGGEDSEFDPERQPERYEHEYDELGEILSDDDLMKVRAISELEGGVNPFTIVSGAIQLRYELAELFLDKGRVVLEEPRKFPRSLLGPRRSIIRFTHLKQY